MATTLIVIGHDEQNTLNLTATALTASTALQVDSCSPGCHQTRTLTTGVGLRQFNFNRPLLAFSNEPSFKPSELYVMQFADTAAALSFVNSSAAFNNTQHRTVLLVENTPATDAAAAAAKPYTLLITGSDATRRLNLDTTGVRVIAECSNCQQTSSLVFGTGAAGVANWTLTNSVANKPAETYVLGFADQQQALDFVRALPAAAEISRKTVLLIQPPATP